MARARTPLERYARSKPLPENEPNPEALCEETAARAYSASESERLIALAQFDAHELAGDPELARITRFAAQLCGASSSAVSLVEAEHQRFIASTGLSETETPRSTSLCAHAMLEPGLFEVLDTTADPRFADFALVTGKANLRYYVGAPLISEEGASLGALCVNDTKPRKEPLSDFQREGLSVLAQAVMHRLHSHRQANVANAELQSSANRLQFMLDSVPDIAWSAAPGPVWDYFNARWNEVTGLPPRQNVDDWREVIHPEDFEASLVKFEEAMTTATMFEDEWRLIQADGSYRWVISRAVPSTSDPETARWFGTLTDIHDRYRISQERELLAGELAHRIKNVFSVINGLVIMHAGQDPVLKSFANTLTDHIRALSRAQDFALRIDGQTGETLKDLLGILMAPYGVPGQSAVSITGDDGVTLGARSATPLALVFHEFATNSAKYGALSTAQGMVAIDVTLAQENVVIQWSETGGPAVEKPADTGFGSRLATMSVEHQLGGTISHDWRGEGLVSVITIPAERLSQ